MQVRKLSGSRKSWARKDPKDLERITDALMPLFACNSEALHLARNESAESTGEASR
jgi:hypothetical protein